MTLKSSAASRKRIALRPRAAAEEAEQARLHRVFPDGVCDYGRPGFEQQGVLDTWLIYVDVGKYKKDNAGNDDQTR